MKLFYLLLAALPLSIAAECRCSSTLCPSTQPAVRWLTSPSPSQTDFPTSQACECENRNAINCAKACNTEPVLQVLTVSYLPLLRSWPFQPSPSFQTHMSVNLWQTININTGLLQIRRASKVRQPGSCPLPRRYSLVRQYSRAARRRMHHQGRLPRLLRCEERRVLRRLCWDSVWECGCDMCRWSEGWLRSGSGRSGLCGGLCLFQRVRGCEEDGEIGLGQEVVGGARGRAKEDWFDETVGRRKEIRNEEAKNQEWKKWMWKRKRKWSTNREKWIEN